MDSGERTYQIGATQIAVGIGISQIQAINPQSYQNGGFFKILSGAGTLSIVQEMGVSYSLGYPIGTAEVISFGGPAKFFLAAATATMVIALCPSYSAGYSFRP